MVLASLQCIGSGGGGGGGGAAQKLKHESGMNHKQLACRQLKKP